MNNKSFFFNILKFGAIFNIVSLVFLTLLLSFINDSKINEIVYNMHQIHFEFESYRIITVSSLCLIIIVYSIHTYFKFFKKDK